MANTENGDPEIDTAKHDVDSSEVDKPKRRRKRKRKLKPEDDEAAESTTSSKHAVVTAADLEKHSQVEKTVYVEGIPFTCTPDQVRTFFSSKGCDIEAVRLPVWHDSGRLKGYGHIVFKDVQSYEKALKLSGQYLEKRYLTIQPANAPKSVESRPATDAEPSNTIILNNLAYSATEDDIEQLAQEFGGPVVTGGVRVVRHSKSQLSKGFAYVEFESIADAQSLVENSSRIVIHGRPCRVDYDHGRMKGSFRGSNGRLWQKEERK